ncbi:putative eif4-gamma eif5 eif2-epsilon protein [Phaeoacremonium minimum UCRPA7]|uniref:Mannose-1-phosphate guanyltransferase n=1 Tax=Phaeoacremonium minimum (strain UCR-PA7) TaxID=1286976 RepID=R8BT85_PHAM7|nr:putative eif4-gamma eif5 eif2-epsilon protein [Phaeoacremonium minimum UCRPA7]EOO02556.1 putative eif4-gamma eif5 eif2-epsilon protein [Phaeoacremonium minimum UCRPA7]
MSQNKGKGKGGGAGKGKNPSKAVTEEKREDALQAVILTDSFQDRFMPFTLEKPRCLLPLANTPLIEYTLEFLAMNGVQDVYIYSGNHTDQVEEYIHQSPKWSPTSKITPFSSLEFVRVSDARSIGDFLRDLDKRGLIAGDFILVHGDLVSNISLDNALAAHKARREANRDAIMTVVLRSGGAEDHRTKSHGITPVYVVESNTGRCLHYEETHPLQSDHYLTLDPSILDHDIEIRSDLIDSGIDICTPDVLALWSESFDYELPRKNFLHGVLKDWELNGKLIYSDIVEEGYAARASNLQMYEALGRDILGRWTYPFVPDNNLVSGHHYKMVHEDVCRERGSMFETNTQVSTSVVGAQTVVGSGSSISNSMIGRRCIIGKNVRIEDSYIWDDVVIDDGTVIKRSVVGNEAVLGKNCSLLAGSVLSFGVQLSDNISFLSPQVLSLFSLDRHLVSTDKALLGPEGKGAAFKDIEDDEDVDPSDPSILQKSLIYSLADLNISTSSISTLASEVDDSSDDEDQSLQPGDLADRARHPSMSSFTSDDSTALASKTSFHTDAVQGLLEALRGDDSEDFDSAKLEFMGLRLSHDASDSSVRRAVTVAFVKRAAELLSPEYGGLEPTKSAEKTVAAKRGAAKFLKEVGVGGGSVDEQVEFTLALQKALVNLRDTEVGRAGTLLAALLQQLYNLDVLEEEGILGWWADKRAAEGDSMTTVREKTKVLVEWLENASEEEESDDDEEDEDDDDED